MGASPVLSIGTATFVFLKIRIPADPETGRVREFPLSCFGAACGAGLRTA